MARKDKLLDVLAMAQLPTEVKLARLAHRWLGKAFSREQAKAVVLCYFEDEGRVPVLTQRLIDEKNRQERIRNERRAFADAAVEAAKSPMRRFHGPAGPAERARRTMEIAKRTFGPHVRDNFNSDALAMMSLISGESRWYEVRWKDADFKPVRSALIEVVTMGKQGPQYSRFLLYKSGRVLVARTGARTVRGAWASQLPQDFVEVAEHLRSLGYSFRSDIEAQQLVVVGPDGAEDRRVDWTGRTVDE